MNEASILSYNSAIKAPTMEKESIKSKLSENHHSFVDFMLALSEDEFMRSANNKWTAGQQMQHIYMSVNPLRKALTVPKFLLKMNFGKANRKSKEYDELVQKYQSKLANGGVAPARFAPKPVHFENRQKLKKALLKEVDRLCRKIDKYSEKELDEYILPHPLLGKVTLREMFYFTIYHVQHHQEISIRNLNA